MEYTDYNLFQECEDNSEELKAMDIMDAAKKVYFDHPELLKLLGIE